MLKYGTNLIQAIGFFGGNYVIAVALTSTISSSGVPILQDYEQPVVTTIAQDAEIIEGPSKISLNCPISFRRIKTPVKGHHCKHHQCFDYENFMAMNSRKPSWRCPHCNQPVSCVDIRMDQNMVKILAETREDVAHVVISADGSWKVVEHHDTGDKLQSGMLTGGTDDSIRYEANTPSHSVSDVVDLTMEEYAQADEAASPRQMELWNNLLNQSGNSNMCDTEERKPFQDTVHAFSQSESISAAQPVNFTSETIQGTHNQVWDDIWSSISMATPTSVATGHVSRPFIQTVGTGLPASLDPVITDAVSPALYREDAETLLPSTSSIQSSAQVQQFMDNLQLQQTYLGIANETERQPIPRHVTRTPIAIQALPAQTPIPSYHQRPWRNAPNLSSVPSSISVQSPSMLVNPDEICAANTGTGRGHVSERRQVSRVPSIVLSSAQIPSVIQQVMGLPAQNSVSTRPLPNQQRGVGSFSMQPHTGGPSSQQQYHNLRPQQTSQAANVMHQPSRFFSVPIQHATQGAVNMVAGSYVNQNPVVNTQQSAQSASARNQVTLVSRMPMSFPTTGESFRLPGGDQVLNVGEGTPEALRSNGVSAVPAEQNWRPTGRMRGSLSGSAYSAALSHYMLQPRPVASSTLGSAAQTRAVSSEYFPLPIVNNVSAGESLNEQPSVRNEDSGGPLQV
uniref:Zinc finger MIZ domain-containing protein 2 n=2 Tax=Anthurium amnicola TaxID=1678845 RepID=A0A1D1ZEU8_9ARAE